MLCMCTYTYTFGLTYRHTYKITELLRLEGTFGVHLVQPHCSQSGYLQKVAQDIVHPGFEYLQRWRLHHLSGKRVHVFNYLHNKKPKVQINFLVFPFVPIAFSAVSGHWEIWLCHLYCLPSNILHIKIRYSWAFSFPGWTPPALSDPTCVNPLLISWCFPELTPVCPGLSRSGKPSTEPNTADVPHQSWVEKDCLPWLGSGVPPGAIQLYRSSTSSPSFVLSANLLKLCSVPLCRPLMKIFDHVGQSIMGYRAGLQLGFMLLIANLWAQQFSQFSVPFTAHLSKCVHVSSACQWVCYRRECQKSQ